MTIGFLAGSFDPLTYGHLDIIKQSCKLVKKLYIGIGTHDTKISLLSEDTRIDVIKKETDEIALNEQCDIQVISFNGLLVDKMKDLEATILFRGIRSATDFDYEMQMVNINRTLYPSLSVCFIPAFGANANISSSLVKQVALMNGNISTFIPPHSAIAIRQLKETEQ